jgi:tRNA threonylcarbamoyladenosine biosynthesis protein TsaE
MSTSGSGVHEVTTTSTEETIALGVRIGQAARGGEALTLAGTLGAGKTTLAKGIGEGLGIDPREVTSPTFLLLHELEGRLRLFHIDAYRVSGAEELAEIGAGEVFRTDSVVLVEWAENVPGLLPGDRLEISIEYDGEERRRFSLTATGSRHRDLLARMEVSP